MARLIPIALCLAALVAVVPGCSTSKAEADRQQFSPELLNVSYDPTRELWRASTLGSLPSTRGTTACT